MYQSLVRYMPKDLKQSQKAHIPYNLAENLLCILFTLTLEDL